MRKGKEMALVAIFYLGCLGRYPRWFLIDLPR